MEGYEARRIEEYRELKERYEKLHKMLIKYAAGKLEFEPTCPIGLLKEQEDTMKRYMEILEIRSCMEDVELI